MWKKLATLLAAVLVVGFIIYRVKWNKDRANTPVNAIVSSQNVKSVFTPDDLATAKNVASQISRLSEMEIESSFRATEDLRDQLINNYIKATSIVKDSALIPDSLDYSQKDPDMSQSEKHPDYLARQPSQDGGGNNSRLLKIMEVATDLPNSKIKERTDFTDLPDFFNNSLPGARSFPLR